MSAAMLMACCGRPFERKFGSIRTVPEKRSHVILDKEGGCSPTTVEVHEFENGFYDKYDLHSQQYEVSNL